MARLHEYQAKQLLREAKIPVPRGAVASSPEEASRIAADIGGPVVVKAQVWATARSKAGGIRFAINAEEAGQIAAALLGAHIKGLLVEQVLVEEKLDIAKEFYAGVIVDDSHLVKAPVLILSTAGGVDIEQVARESPEHIARMSVDVRRGVRPYHAGELALAIGLSGEALASACQVLVSLYGVFRRNDARSVEINPLVLTTAGKWYAADCRVSIDDASVSRHPELGIAFARESDRPPTELEKIAWRIEQDDYRGVSFFAQLTPEVRESGYIGYHAIGGGGALLAADALGRHGLKLADYAETSGNPPASKVYRIAKIILSQPGIQGYCLMGAVMSSQDLWHHAHGLVKAFREELAGRPGFPVVILLCGNKEEESLRILHEGLHHLPICLELYGREHIHRLDAVAARMRALVDGYQTAGKAGGRV